MPLLSGCGGATFISASGAATSGKLQASTANISFGSVATGQTVSSSLLLVNQGAESVQISQMAISGSDFIINWKNDLPITVAAGASYSLSLSFSPASSGAKTGHLAITSNSGNSGSLAIGLSGTGTESSSTAPTLSSVNCSTGSLTGSGTDACSVSLTAAAPSGGFVVSLSSDNAALTVPASVTIPAGSSDVSFSASVAAVSATQAARLTAEAGGVSQTFPFELLASSQSSTSTAALNAISCATNSFTAAGTDNCSINLTAAAPSGGFTASISSNNAAVTVPTTVTVPAGSRFVGFTGKVSAVTSVQTVTLTASAGTVSKAFALQLNVAQSGAVATPVLSSLSCATTSISGAGSDACTVTLGAAAPTGGFAVSISSNNAAVVVPGNVIVPAGSTNATISATIGSVTTAQSATVTASAGGVSKSVALQLSGSTSAVLSINSSSLAFGNVALNAPATQSITLTSTGGLPVTVNSATVSGAGFTLSASTFPVTLNAGQSHTLNVQFDPTVAGAATGTLTILSTSASSPSAVVALTGTGVATITYEVDLSWTAPSSSSDPVVGYNVYRSISGTSSYQQLNSPAITQTTYADTSVQAGQSYDYEVESVDAAGLTSSPSNILTLPIP